MNRGNKGASGSKTVPKQDSSVEVSRCIVAQSFRVQSGNSSKANWRDRPSGQENLYLTSRKATGADCLTKESKSIVSWRESCSPEIVVSEEEIDLLIIVRNGFDHVLVNCGRGAAKYCFLKFGLKRTIDFDLAYYSLGLIQQVELNPNLFPDIDQVVAIEALCTLRMSRDSTGHVLLTKIRRQEYKAWYICAMMVVFGPKMLDNKAIWEEANALRIKHNVTYSEKFVSVKQYLITIRKIYPDWEIQ